MLGAVLGERNIYVGISVDVEMFLFSKEWRLLEEPYSQWGLKFRRENLARQ
jgi:hypothetical protein